MTAEVQGAVLTPDELTAIEDVLAGADVTLSGPLEAELISGGRSNLTIRLSDGSATWVMRTPPRAGRTPSAHDVAREFRVTKALGDTDVPVARAVALSEDESMIGGPFAIAEFVQGSSIQTADQLDNLSDAELQTSVERLVATLSALHRVDHIAIGLERFGRPDAYAERQLARWSGQWEIVGEKRLQPLGAEVIDALRRNVPRQAATSIVHGDYRIDNTLLDLSTDAPKLAAVVDWELSTIGDPVADVAMMCAYRDSAFDLIVGAPSAWSSARLPAADELAAAYEKAGGADLVDWEQHAALAYFKVAVIAAGIAHRVTEGAGSGSGFATSGLAVEPFLTRALEMVARLQGRQS